jgi:carbon-monoxide dehydrogenase small subunit
VKRPVRLIVNGRAVESSAEPRTSLADLLRDALDLTGTHVGCEHGVCGACTVLLDGEPIRACLMLAVQAEGQRITTIEGLGHLGPAGTAGSGSLAVGPADAALHPLQQAFRDNHALQCGFCTPGIVLTAHAFLRENPRPSHEEIREMLSGNLCRCTGYHFIVEAIADAARRMAEGPPGRPS